MQDTVTIKILRSAYIETNSDVALIRLNSMEHKIGQPVMVSYYNTDGDVEYIVAIGTRNGVGKDCYSILSTSKEEVINGVVDELPDVSELVNDAVYICNYEGEWSRVYIWSHSVKRVDPLDATKSLIFRDIVTGFRWFWVNGKFYREDDFVSRQEIKDRFDNLKPEKIFTAEFLKGTVHLKGEQLLEPVLRIYIKEGAKDVTGDYNISVRSTAHGTHETIKSIEGNLLTLYKTIDVTATYTMTATLQDTNEEIPETLETSCMVVFVPYTLYTTTQTNDVNSILGNSTFNQILWGGLDDLELVFNNMDFAHTVILIPSDINIPAQILDKHGLDYRDDYTVEDVVYSDEAYKMLVKKDAVSMGSFKQILKHE